MEVGTEQDSYEFEMLLGEIPNATSANPQAEESVPVRYTSRLAGLPMKEETKKSSSPGACATGYHVSQAGSPNNNEGCQRFSPSKNQDMDSVNSSQNTFDHQFQTNGDIDGREKVRENGYHSPIESSILEDSNLPDDQSLASALTQMNLKDRVANEEMNPRLVNFKNMPKSMLLWQDKYQTTLKKPHTSSDTQNVAVTSPQSPNIVNGTTLKSSTTDDDGKIDVKLHTQEGTKFSELDVQDAKKQGNWSSQQLGNLSGALGEQRQCVPVYSGASPLAQNMHSFQLLPSNYVPAVDFPVVPYPQQYFLNAQTPTPYMQQQQISRSQIPWHNMEEERYYRLQQQYYMQQYHGQTPESQFPSQRNMSMTARSVTGNERQPYLKKHNSHMVEQANDEHFWDNASVQVLDKMRRHAFPEKILTKSHGLNLLKVINANSIGSNELIGQKSSFLNSGLHYLDDRVYPGSSPDCADLRMYSMRSQPLKFNSLDEVLGKIYLIARDQIGCRFLQKKFAEGSAEDVEKIFVEIIGHIVDLMTNPFGNYLVQKLLEVCTKDQKMQILHAITRKPGELVKISLDLHGTRVVQKVIETLRTPEQFNLVVSSLKPGIVNLMKDTNGNHVAQRCLQHLLPEYKEFLFEDVISHCSKLAKDRHACCVLQKCLGHFDGEHRRRLVCGITSDALSLSQNQYGNYVVQFVFELCLPWATAAMLDRLEGSYGYLSMQKYSSNVVEKCLKFAGDDRCPRIVQELVTDPRLDQILQDPYGNYVIQAALNHSKGAAHAALVEAIRPHVPALRTSPYGKKILSSNGLKK